MSQKIKVLVVEDSSLVRKIITDILSRDPEIEVVGTANNGITAIFRNDQLNPDVITMDIEMPIMDGLEALRHIIKKNPKPVIMMSVLTRHGTEATFKALEYGAVDFIPKPATNISLSVSEISDILIEKVKSVYRSNIKLTALTSKETIEAEGKIAENREERKINSFEIKEKSDKVIGIGTSTGGPSALMEIFKKFPVKFPSPVLVVQHMPEGFTKAFSERLNIGSALKVKEAEDGDILFSGCGYIAPGDFHMKVENSNSSKIIRLYKGEKVSGHRPSIDVLFNSMAECCGKNSVCVIMTGMGQDGADGILKVKNMGGHTMAQDESTSIVYGMNRVAVSKGAIDEIVPLYEIPERIIRCL